MWFVGVDEAGRGPTLGPLVVAAFAIPESDLKMLEEMGVKDSKLLSSAKRKTLFSWIKSRSEARGWQFAIHHSSPAAIDLAMQLSNLNYHEVDLFAHILNKIDLADEGGQLQLDACDTNAIRFGQNVSAKLQDWPKRGWSIDSRHGADSFFLATAAASILAKESRDLAIDELKEKLGIDIGSGYPSDPKTKAAIPLLLQEKTPHECLRWRWATVKKAWEKLGKGETPIRANSVENGPVPAQRTLF
ncbi:MAG: ribonuclease HII [Euryarchaeota archaeon]|jgi:ribonuclease HII|nr:ribonuclease HII [Euryarchaeota archaeon]MBT3971610.1 ribonuclease HII [Euryarchaeota archaeon]